MVRLMNSQLSGLWVENCVLLKFGDESDEFGLLLRRITLNQINNRSCCIVEVINEST